MDEDGCDVCVLHPVQFLLVSLWSGVELHFQCHQHRVNLDSPALLEISWGQAHALWKIEIGDA